MALTENQKWHASWIIGTLGALGVGALIAWATLDMATSFVVLGLGWVFVVLLLWVLTPPRRHLAAKIAVTLMLTISAVFAGRWIYAYDRPILVPQIGRVVILNDKGDGLVLAVEGLIKNAGRPSGYADVARLVLTIDGSPTDGKEVYAKPLPPASASEPELYNQEFPPGKPVRGWLFFSFPGMSFASVTPYFACGSDLLKKVGVRLSIRDSTYGHEWDDSKKLKELGDAACFVPTAPVEAPKLSSPPRVPTAHISHLRPPPAPTQALPPMTCTGSNCAGINNGSQTLNNYGVANPPPGLTIVSETPLEAKENPNPVELAMRPGIDEPGVSVTFTINGYFYSPAFAARCSSPCKFSEYSLPGTSFSPSILTSKTDPNVVGVLFTAPNVIPPNTKMTLTFRSLDARNISLEWVRPYVPPSN